MWLFWYFCWTALAWLAGEGGPEVRGIPVRRWRERLSCEVLAAGSRDGAWELGPGFREKIETSIHPPRERALACKEDDKERYVPGPWIQPKSKTEETKKGISNARAESDQWCASPDEVSFRRKGQNMQTGCLPFSSCVHTRHLSKQAIGLSVALSVWFSVVTGGWSRADVPPWRVGYVLCPKWPQLLKQVHLRSLACSSSGDFSRAARWSKYLWEKINWKCSSTGVERCCFLWAFRGFLCVLWLVSHTVTKWFRAALRLLEGLAVWKRGYSGFVFF